MLQPIFGKVSTTFSTSATNYGPLTLGTPSSTVANQEQIMSAAGSIRKVTITQSAASGVGATFTYTLQKNNVDTAIVITITGAVAISGSDTTNTVDFAAGDNLKWKVVPTGSPAGVAVANVSFELLTPGNLSLFPTGGLTVTSVTPVWFGVLAIIDDSTTAAANRTCVAPCAGVITGYRAYRAGTAAAGGSFDFSIYKNGTKQDGSGGTVDTRASLSGTGATNTVTASFSLSVAAGDLLYLQSDKNGSPNSSQISICVTFNATNYEFPICGITPALSTSTGNQFQSVAPLDASTVAGTEPGQQTSITSPVELTKMYCNLSAAPSAGKSRTIAFRKNTADSTLTLTIADAATTGNDIHKVKLAVADLTALREAAASSATVAAILSWGLSANPGGGQNAGGGNSNNGKKGGGGGLNVLNPGGATFIQLGNTGLDVGITS